ncbi:MAG: hypothetical protein KAJ07_10575 [Planctomycetes bacterium]|nr:hypothetical protein [Planctomycetota bacterium]
MNYPEPTKFSDLREVVSSAGTIMSYESLARELVALKAAGYLDMHSGGPGEPLFITLTRQGVESLEELAI